MEDNKEERRPDDPEQSARFVELADQIQTEDAEERFEEAMQKIVSAQKQGKMTNSDHEDRER